jgi:hypothetical protein
VERPGHRQRLQLGLSEEVHLNVCFFSLYTVTKNCKKP